MGSVCETPQSSTRVRSIFAVGKTAIIPRRRARPVAEAVLHAGRRKHGLPLLHRDDLVTKDRLELALQDHHRLLCRVEVRRRLGAGLNGDVADAERVRTLRFHRLSPSALTPGPQRFHLDVVLVEYRHVSPLVRVSYGSHCYRTTGVLRQAHEAHSSHIHA